MRKLKAKEAKMDSVLEAAETVYILVVVSPSNPARLLPLANFFIFSFCEAVLPRCTVGSRQAEHESQESMEEDDMVMR